MKRTVSGAIVSGFAMLSLVGCSSESDPVAVSTMQEATPLTSLTTVKAVPSTTAPPITTSVPQTTPYVVPEYWMRANGPRYITVVVPTRYPAAQMTRVMQDVVDMHAGEEGGWHVNIVCGMSADDTSGATLGTSSFALDNLGLAQTGLKSKFQAATIIQEGAKCS